MRIVSEFKVYTAASGWVYVDPDVSAGVYQITVVTTPAETEDVIESRTQCSHTPAVDDDIYRKEAGVFFFDTGESDEYVDGSWYRARFTALIDSETVEASRLFCYSSGEEPEPPVPSPETGRLVQAAEYIKNRLNTGSFTESFTAARDYAISFDMKALRTLRVTVIPSTREIERATRAAVGEDYEIVVAIMKRARTTTEVDALVKLTEQIMDWIIAQHRYGDFALLKVANDPALAADHVRAYKVFTSILVVTMEGMS